jgi:NADH dehydrogenase
MLTGPIVVTGATGFVGRHLVRALAAEGRQVVAVARPGRDCEALEGPGVRVARADLTDPPSLVEAARGASAMVHLAAATDVSDEAVNRRLNVDGVRHVVEACRAAGVRRLVAFSSHCAGRAKRDAYGQTKLEGEAVVRESGLAWTSLRPTMICGPGSKEFETFLALVRRLPVVPVIGPGTFLLRPCALEEVVPVVGRCLDREATVGQTYELAGGEALSMRELIALAAGLMGKRRPVVSVPAWLVLPAVRFLGALTTHTPLSVDQVMAFLQDTVADLEPARRDLDFRPRPLRESLSWLGRE